MAKLAGLHHWIGVVSSIFVFSVTSAAAAQHQDVFDLFLEPQRAKAAPPAESIHRPHSNSQHVRRHEGGDTNSIFGLFVPHQAARMQSRRTPQASAQARAPTKIFDSPKVRSKRDIPFTPRLAVIVKPKSVIANAALVKPKARPGLQPAQVPRKYDCEQARAIIGKYAFGNVQAKSCEGEVYSFAAERSGKPFVVKISALNGELVEVKKASE
jgi:hypothetical protein